MQILLLFKCPMSVYFFFSRIPIEIQNTLTIYVGNGMLSAILWVEGLFRMKNNIYWQTYAFPV